ncbi:MAG: hypothetical protein OXF73_09070, partial [Gammaproteobacteria bacterium]|nr:hypothetical protein [Gammaproteobacteria bacterium]
MAAPFSMPERGGGACSRPHREFRASESVAVSGRSLAGPEETGDQGSRQVRIRQSISSSRPRLEGGPCSLLLCMNHRGVDVQGHPVPALQGRL